MRTKYIVKDTKKYLKPNNYSGIMSTALRNKINELFLRVVILAVIIVVLL